MGKDKKERDPRYNVELTRAIKENHGYPFNDAKLNPFEGGEKFYATAGANQINIYDLQVRGNFISTFLNYRNWDLQTMRTKHIVWKENHEKFHPEKLEKKTFITLCWMRRYEDFYVAAADNEQRVHLLSLQERKCVKIMSMESNIINMCSHPIYPNILCVVDANHKCRFINICNEEVIYTLPDKICQIRFSPSTNKLCAVLVNGVVREYSHKVEIEKNDDNKMDEDDDETPTKKEKKKIVINNLNQYKFEEKGSNISDIHYCGESVIIAGNEQGEFKMVNIDNMQLLHQWKVSGPIETGNVCKFDVDKKNECVVYGNGDHQVQVYDVWKKKYITKVDTGRGRKFPFLFAQFCRNHPQSVMMVADSVVMKFDPFELVSGWFPTTDDWKVQKRNGVQVFLNHKTVIYEGLKN